MLSTAEPRRAVAGMLRPSIVVSCPDVAELPTRRFRPPAALSLARPFTSADAINAGYTRGLIRHLVSDRPLAGAPARRLTATSHSPSGPTRFGSTRPPHCLSWPPARRSVTRPWPHCANGRSDAASAAERSANRPVTYVTHPPTSRHARRSHPGVVERAAALPASHLAYFQGLLITTAARTVVDLARLVPYAEGVAVADAALHLGAATNAQLVAVRDACRSWPGINAPRGDRLRRRGSRKPPRVAFQSCLCTWRPAHTHSAGRHSAHERRSGAGRLLVGAVAGHRGGRRSPEDPASRGALGGEAPGRRACANWATKLSGGPGTRSSTTPRSLWPASCAPLRPRRDSTRIANAGTLRIPVVAICVTGSRIHDHTGM